MITSCFVYQATGYDPYENLAAEQNLLEHLQPQQCILYLWQNQNTVVIGRNQNAWAECRTALLQSEGGKLARRLSGGGAVFHDLGNLNFTFLLNDEDFQIEKQLSVIKKACALAGIETETSGRNDVLAGGRKFSGNAFYHSKGHAYHHGTLLIDADMDKLQRYLSPSKAKLEAKGIASVRSRVVNLTELAAGLTVKKMEQYMCQAFGAVYGIEPAELVLPSPAKAEIAATAQAISSWDYLFGTPLPFTCQMEQRFPWGNVQLQIEAKGGVIQAVRVYSDAMDWQLPQLLEAALMGCRFTKEDICSHLVQSDISADISQDLQEMIRQQDI